MTCTMFSLMQLLGMEARQTVSSRACCVEGLTGGRKWQVVIVIWFFLSLQHILFPLAGLTWQILVSWFIGLIPAAIFYCWLWWRLGRLLPIIVAHVLTDAVTVLVSIYFLG
jgi:hypothetical protein